MTSKPKKYYAEEIVDAVNHGQPDAYAVLRHPETHQLCLIYMGRFLPLAHFEMDFQREDGEPFAATADTMQWKLVLYTDPDIPASACLALLDQKNSVVLSSAQDQFGGQLWMIGVAPQYSRATAIHAVFGVQGQHSVGSLLIDRSPILAKHWQLSSQYLRPGWCQERMNELVGYF